MWACYDIIYVALCSQPLISGTAQPVYFLPIEHATHTTTRLVVPLTLQYVTDQVTPLPEDYNELSLATTEYMRAQLADHWDGTAIMFHSVEMQLFYIRELYRVEMQPKAHFRSSIGAPTMEDLDVVVRGLFTDGAPEYIKELRLLDDSNVFSTTSSVKLVGSEVSLEDVIERNTNPQPMSEQMSGRKSYLLPTMLGVVGATLLTAFSIQLYRKRNRRSTKQALYDDDRVESSWKPWGKQSEHTDESESVHGGEDPRPPLSEALESGIPTEIISEINMASYRQQETLDMPGGPYPEITLGDGEEEV